MLEGARNRGALVSITLLGFFVVGCGLPRCDGPSSRMIGELHSRQTLAEVKAQLGKPVSVVVDSAHASVPGLEELWIEMEEFQHLGHRGRLRLAFANGRLYHARFSPSAPREYIAGVERLAGAIRPAAGEVWFDPSTRVHLVDVMEQGLGVAWEDECIGEEVAIRKDARRPR
jgi:hypothetical protein